MSLLPIGQTVRGRIIAEIARRLSDDNAVGLVVTPDKIDATGGDDLSPVISGGKFAVFMLVVPDEVRDPNLSQNQVNAEFDVGLVIVLPAALPDGASGAAPPADVASAVHAWVQGLYATAQLEQWAGADGQPLARRTEVLGGGALFVDDASGQRATESSFRVAYAYVRGDPATPR